MISKRVSESPGGSAAQRPGTKTVSHRLPQIKRLTAHHILHQIYPNSSLTKQGKYLNPEAKIMDERYSVCGRSMIHERILCRSLLPEIVEVSMVLRPAGHPGCAIIHQARQYGLQMANGTVLSYTGCLSSPRSNAGGFAAVLKRRHLKPDAMWKKYIQQTAQSRLGTFDSASNTRRICGPFRTLRQRFPSASCPAASGWAQSSIRRPAS